ncbi:MAG: LD-carboxypeptidase [Bacteroidales bacterium]|jgi:muramoyltetrapeptide carboxypeptidase|nr:LD-carboxypeptidase [Bacteroidales bacterium]
MKTPPCIKPGSKIRIVSPAGKVDEKYIIPAVKWLQNNGYQTILGKNIFARHYQFAGTDSQRLYDLQTAIDDQETAVIICSRGGYGTVRIIDKLNFSALHSHPKWIVGFSDITILHACLNKFGLTTVHGAMPRYFFEDGEPTENLRSLMQILTTGKISYYFENVKQNRTGKVNGELIGGNLSIISSLHGTKYEIETDGKILFLEDTSEYLYHIDRMIYQLKLAGKLDNLAGLIIGDFTNIKDNESPFGKTIHEIIDEAVQDHSFPVAYGFAAGHGEKNLALTFGGKWELNVSGKQSELKLL